MESTNALSGKELKIEVSGSGNVKIGQANYQRIESQVAGSGNLEIGGSADDGEFHVSGSGDINGKEVKCKRVTCSVSGSGNLSCFASDTLNAKVSGSGDIQYAGSPKSVNEKASGSGSINSF